MTEDRVAPPFEVVIEIGGRIHDESHAFDGNDEGRTACGLFPDRMSYRHVWKIAKFSRCRKCEAIVRERGPR